jgi:iron complex outermembrane receptor protein
MSRSQRLKDCVRLALIAAGAATTAAALPSIAIAAGAEEGNEKITEVIVTAQKREESLTEVPVAISAFTSQQRDQLGITSVVDMANFTPGFVYNTGQDRVSMRGIGRYTNQLGADSSVGVYEDGVFETFTVKAGNSSLYTDRIEILRGPQGTLYGRASIGGAVNIISRRPTHDWYSEARVSYDNYNNHVEEGAISGPISDTLRFRLAATKYDQTDGYFKNVGSGPDSGNVRNEWVYEGQLEWDATAKDQFWVKVFGGQWDNGGGNAGGRTTNQVLVGLDGKTPTPAGTYFANLVPTSTTLGFQLTNNALIPSLGVGYLTPAHTTLNATGVNPGNNNIRDFYSNYPQTVKLSDYYGGVLHYNHDFDGFSVKYIGGLQHYDYVENVEWGEGYILASGLQSYQLPGQAVTFPDSVLFYEERQTINSNEVNFISTGDGALQWVGGIYNFNQHFFQPESVYRPGQTQLATPINGPANPHQDNFFGEGIGGSKAWAGYGQLDWNFTPTWKATLGARYEKDWKWGDDSGSLFLFVPTGAGFTLNLTNVPGVLPLGVAYQGATPAVYNAATGRAERRLEGDWSGVTGTAGVQWNPDDKTNLYFKYSRGFKSGGFNIGAGIVPNPETDLEHSNDFQIGYKAVFANAFQLNVDAFYDNYYNAQIPIGSMQASGLIATSFFNMPEARSSGVEVEMLWQATSALQFIFNYGYNKTEIIESGCIVDASGDPTGTLIGAQRRNCTGGSQNVQGNQLPNAPENKLAFNTNYTFAIGGDASLMFSGSYIWRDKQFGSVFNRPYTEAPSWDQADVRATYKQGQHLTVIAFMKNVFNDTGYSSGASAAKQNDATGAPAGFVKNYALTPPRVYGAELQYKF